MNRYLVTGGTGAVGSALVPRLLDDPDTEVHLLLRAVSDAQLRQRLESLFAYWGWEPESPFRQRVNAHRGDAAVPRFGLAGEAYQTLASTCTHVIHSAGTVRMNLGIDDARHSAVGSAEATVAFARELAGRGRLCKFEYVSTVGIAGKRPGALPEVWLDEPRAFHNTYEQAKAEAEEVVRRAVVDDRLPVTVHRPSMVIGDSRDGRIIHFQIFYFICEFLTGRKTLGLFPDFGDVRLDVIPVDSVADAIVAASRDPTTAGRIFHLCSGPAQAPRLEDLKVTVREAFKAHGLRVPPGINLPRPAFALLARVASRLAPAAHRKALATLPIYLDYLADRQGFDNAGYAAWLHDRGVHVPSPAAYMPRVLDHYLGRRYSPDASRVGVP